MAEDKNISLVVSLTRQDIYQANVSIAQSKRSTMRKVLSIVSFVVSVAVLFYFAMLRSEPDYPWQKAFVIGICLGLVLELFLWALTLASIHGVAYYAAKSLARSKPVALEPISYEFSPGGATYSGPTGSGHLKWNTYIKVRETPGQFLLYLQKRLANIIPKTTFASDAEVQRFRVLVRDHFEGEIDLPKNI